MQECFVVWTQHSIPDSLALYLFLSLNLSLYIYLYLLTDFETVVKIAKNIFVCHPPNQIKYQQQQQQQSKSTTLQQQQQQQHLTNPATRHAPNPCAPIPLRPRPRATAATGRRRSSVSQLRSSSSRCSRRRRMPHNRSTVGWEEEESPPFCSISSSRQRRSNQLQQQQQQQHPPRPTTTTTTTASILRRQSRHQLRDSSGPSQTFRVCQLAASSLIRKPSNQFSMQTGNLQKPKTKTKHQIQKKLPNKKYQIVIKIYELENNVVLQRIFNLIAMLYCFVPAIISI